MVLFEDYDVYSEDEVENSDSENEPVPQATKSQRKAQGVPRATRNRQLITQAKSRVDTKKDSAKAQQLQKIKTAATSMDWNVATFNRGDSYQRSSSNSSENLSEFEIPLSETQMPTTREEKQGEDMESEAPDGNLGTNLDPMDDFFSKQQKILSKNRKPLPVKKRKRHPLEQFLPIKKRKLTPDDSSNSRNYVTRTVSSGIASNFELTNRGALRARREILAQQVTSKRSQTYTGASLDQGAQNLTQNLVWKQSHEVSLKKLQRTRRVQALAPSAPSAEPICSENQRDHSPFENEDPDSGKRIRNNEDLITMLYRESWGTIPELRDKHRADKASANFVTSFERRFLKMYADEVRNPSKDYFKMDSCKGVRRVLQHCWGLQFRLAEMQRVQWTFTQSLLSRLLEVPVKTETWREKLEAILDSDKRSTGVSWFIQERIGELIEQAYNPTHTAWNDNSNSRVDFLIGQLRESWDFLTPRERNERLCTFTKKEHKDPLKTPRAEFVRKLTQKDNVTRKVSESGKETDQDQLAKEAIKTLSTAHFLRF